MGGRNVVFNDEDELEKEDERGAPDADAINLNESDDDEDEDNDEEGKMSRRRMGYNEMIAEVEYCGCFQELWSRSKIEGYPKATAVLVHDYGIYVHIDQCKDSVPLSFNIYGHYGIERMPNNIRLKWLMMVEITRNKAGIMFCPFQLSSDGIESQFATNILGHFQVSNLLLEKNEEDNKHYWELG